MTEGTDEPLLSRHEADLAAVARVSRANFHGPVFESFINDLYKYAWPVILDAIRTGTIVTIQTGLPPRIIPADERQLSRDSEDCSTWRADCGEES